MAGTLMDVGVENKDPPPQKKKKQAESIAEQEDDYWDWQLRYFFNVVLAVTVYTSFFLMPFTVSCGRHQVKPGSSYINSFFLVMIKIF